MTRDTLMLWLSAGKPVTAAAVMQLVERGRVQLDDPVARYVPEFAVNGKETFTLWNLLTHTRGFAGSTSTGPKHRGTRSSRGSARPSPSATGRRVSERVTTPLPVGTSWAKWCSAWPRGRFRNTCARRFFLPLGMRDSWIGMPAEQFDAYGDRLGILVHTDKGRALCPEVRVARRTDVLRARRQRLWADARPGAVLPDAARWRRVARSSCTDSPQRAADDQPATRRDVRRDVSPHDGLGPGPDNRLEPVRAPTRCRMATDPIARSKRLGTAGRSVRWALPIPRGNWQRHWCSTACRASCSTTPGRDGCWPRCIRIWGLPASSDR